MSEPLASEICRDLKRSNRRKDIVLALASLVLSLAGLALAIENSKPKKHTVATFTGR